MNKTCWQHRKKFHKNDNTESLIICINNYTVQSQCDSKNLSALNHYSLCDHRLISATANLRTYQICRYHGNGKREGANFFSDQRYSKEVPRHLCEMFWGPTKCWIYIPALFMNKRWRRVCVHSLFLSLQKRWNVAGLNKIQKTIHSLVPEFSFSPHKLKGNGCSDRHLADYSPSAFHNSNLPSNILGNWFLTNYF